MELGHRFMPLHHKPHFQLVMNFESLDSKSSYREQKARIATSLQHSTKQENNSKKEKAQWSQCWSKLEINISSVVWGRGIHALHCCYFTRQKRQEVWGWLGFDYASHHPQSKEKYTAYESSPLSLVGRDIDSYSQSTERWKRSEL